MRALILDDEPDIGRVICRIAERSGLSAQAVTDLGAFQSQLKLTHPDLIVLDLQLGGDDGLVQLRLLADHGYAGPVILMSGHDRHVLSSAERSGRDLGLMILATVNKPFGPEELTPLFNQITSGAFSSSVERPC
jgi:DNA-binding response OmpR family regulator